MMNFLGPTSANIVWDDDDVTYWDIPDNPNAALANSLAQMAEQVGDLQDGQLRPPPPPPVDNFEMDRTGQPVAVRQDPELVRKIRKENCGKFSRFWIDIHTGKMRRGPFFCGLWRDHECEECYIRHVIEVRDQIQAAFKTCNDLYFTRMDHKKCTSFLHRIKRNEYIRQPVVELAIDEEFVVDLLIMHRKHLGSVPGAQLLTYAHVFGKEGLTIDYYAVADTPSPLRRSGSLGKMPATAPVERTIRVPHMSVDLKRSPKKAFRAGILKLCTEGHAPKELTYDAVQEAANANFVILSKAFAAAGGKIIGITAKNVRVNLKRICWDTYIRFNMVVTPRLREEIDLFVSTIQCPEEVTGLTDTL